MSADHGDDTMWAGEALGAWKEREIRIAKSFRECSGLSIDVVEDIYQEATVALWRRHYESEEHLRNALRDGIKKRALTHHRDDRAHRRVLQANATAMHRIAVGRAEDEYPERQALLKEILGISRDFLTELTDLETQVFGGLVEGKRYRAIAAARGIDLKEARNASRVVESKRERFERLFEAGRLCAVRSAAIAALQDGKAISEELSQQALAHLDSCSHCRAKYQTIATRLRSRA